MNQRTNLSKPRAAAGRGAADVRRSRPVIRPTRPSAPPPPPLPPRRRSLAPIPEAGVSTYTTDTATLHREPERRQATNDQTTHRIETRPADARKGEPPRPPRRDSNAVTRESVVSPLPVAQVIELENDNPDEIRAPRAAPTQPLLLDPRALDPRNAARNERRATYPMPAPAPAPPEPASASSPTYPQQALAPTHQAPRPYMYPGPQQPWDPRAGYGTFPPPAMPTPLAVIPQTPVADLPRSQRPISVKPRELASFVVGSVFGLVVAFIAMAFAIRASLTPETAAPEPVAQSTAAPESTVQPMPAAPAAPIAVAPVTAAPIPVPPPPPTTTAVDELPPAPIENVRRAPRTASAPRAPAPPRAPAAQNNAPSAPEAPAPPAKKGGKSGSEITDMFGEALGN